MPDITHQYRIIATGAGWTDRSARGRVRLAGADALSFLQALVSNDVASLGVGDGAYATYLTPQGRMIADMRVYSRQGYVLLDVAPATAATLASRLDQLIFAEDVQPTDATSDVDQIGVAGGAAADVLARATGLDAARIAGLALWQQIDLPNDTEGFLVRTDDAALPWYDVFVGAGRGGRLTAALGAAGVAPMSTDLVESLRVSAARPAFGIDMTEQTIPLEAGLLERAISTDKGCYVGQEVIIRMLHRGGGRVARRVAQLAFDSAIDTAPPAGSAITVDGRDVGRLTSVARALDDSHWIGLGTVHRDAAEIGRRLAVGGEQPNAAVAAFAGT